MELTSWLLCPFLEVHFLYISLQDSVASSGPNTSMLAFAHAVPSDVYAHAASEFPFSLHLLGETFLY